MSRLGSRALIAGLLLGLAGACSAAEPAAEGGRALAWLGPGLGRGKGPQATLRNPQGIAMLDQ